MRRLGVGTQRLRGHDTVHHRHLDVQENQIGLELPDAADRIPAVAEFPDHVDVLGPFPVQPVVVRADLGDDAVREAELRASELTVPTATERLGMLIEQLRTADHAELERRAPARTWASVEEVVS